MVESRKVVMVSIALLALTVIGAYALVKSCARKWRIAIVFWCVLLGLGLLLLMASYSPPTMVWDGRYPQAEFQLVFKEAEGAALEGIELRVEDQEGRSYAHYPVSDYFPGKVPVSDRDGVVVFHHVSHGIEFSGRTKYWFGVVPIVEKPAPVFVCRFLHNGQEVYRAPFRELCRSSGSSSLAPTVTRVWKWPVWPESQLLREAQRHGDLLRDQNLRLFDLNGNGKLDPEEQAAFTAAAKDADRAALAHLRGDKHQEELEFVVIRKTIVVGSRNPGK